MPYETARQLDQVDPASTVRIDRRQTVLAQLEAVLLCDKLIVQEATEDRTGTDPYNSSHPGGSTWSGPAS